MSTKNIETYMFSEIIRWFRKLLMIMVSMITTPPRNNITSLIRLSMVNDFIVIGGASILQMWLSVDSTYCKAFTLE